MNSVISITYIIETKCAYKHTRKVEDCLGCPDDWWILKDENVALSWCNLSKLKANTFLTKLTNLGLPCKLIEVKTVTTVIRELDSVGTTVRATKQMSKKQRRARNKEIKDKAWLAENTKHKNS